MQNILSEFSLKMIGLLVFIIFWGIISLIVSSKYHDYEQDESMFKVVQDMDSSYFGDLTPAEISFSGSYAAKKQPPKIVCRFGKWDTRIEDVDHVVLASIPDYLVNETMSFRASYNQGMINFFGDKTAVFLSRSNAFYLNKAKDAGVSYADFKQDMREFLGGINKLCYEKKTPRNFMGVVIKQQ